MKRLFTSQDKIDLSKMSTRDGKEIHYCAMNELGNIFYCIGAEIYRVSQKGLCYKDTDRRFDLFIEVPEPTIRTFYMNVYSNRVDELLRQSITDANLWASGSRLGVAEILFTDNNPTAIRLVDKSEYENI